MTERTLRAWHRLFGVGLFAGSGWRVELEKELALTSQLLEVVVIESDAAAPALPDGLENLRPCNLLTYKSQHEALDEPVGHYADDRKLARNLRRPPPCRNTGRHRSRRSRRCCRSATSSPGRRNGATMKTEPSIYEYLAAGPEAFRKDLVARAPQAWLAIGTAPLSPKVRGVLERIFAYSLMERLPSRSGSTAGSTGYWMPRAWKDCWGRRPAAVGPRRLRGRPTVALELARYMVLNPVRMRYPRRYLG